MNKWDEFNMDGLDEFETINLDFITKIYDSLDALPKKQMYHGPTQVIRRSELKVGEYYWDCHKRHKIRFELLKEPFEDEDGNWKIVLLYDSWNIHMERFLCDSGVVPYSNGGWNKSNYITFD